MFVSRVGEGAPEQTLPTCASPSKTGVPWRGTRGPGVVRPTRRRVGAAYALFILANLLPPLIQGGLLSIGRFTATLFPLFLALALLAAGRRTTLVIVFAITQGFVATVFFTWRPIY